MAKELNVVVVGRHTSDFGSMNVNVVATENMTFPTSVEETMQVLRDLQQRTVKAAQANTILLQNTPGIVAVALTKLTMSGFFLANPLSWGVIISIPGERQAGVSEEFHFDWGEGGFQAEKAVKFANGRAITKLDGDSSPGEEILTVTVDPVTPFRFSHVEWFYQTPETPEEVKITESNNPTS